jgi:hypothetical protein
MVSVLLTDSELRVRYILRVLNNIGSWQLNRRYFHAGLVTELLRC